jgi:hypothetical protein
MYQRKGLLVFRLMTMTMTGKTRYMPPPLFLLQVNLCQKLLFLHQLTHNMTTDCSLNYHFSIHENSKLRTWGEHEENMRRTAVIECLRTSILINQINWSTTKNKV